MFRQLLIYFLKKPAVQETLVDIVMGYSRTRPTPLIDERDAPPLPVCHRLCQMKYIEMRRLIQVHRSLFAQVVLHIQSGVVVLNAVNKATKQIFVEIIFHLERFDFGFEHC